MRSYRVATLGGRAAPGLATTGVRTRDQTGITGQMLCIRESPHVAYSQPNRRPQNIAYVDFIRSEGVSFAASDASGVKNICARVGPKTICHLMNYVIDLDPTHQAFRVTMTGTVTDQGCREMYARLSQVVATGGPYAAIFDMSGVTKGQVSAEAIPDSAPQPPALPVGRLRVVVAPRHIDYGLARMLELWRDGMGGQFQVVSSEAKAYAMLGVNAEGFSRRLFLSPEKSTGQPETAGRRTFYMSFFSVVKQRFRKEPPRSQTKGFSCLEN